jgi:hypothetical protein
MAGPVFNLNETPDRVTVSRGRKISDGQYGSHDLFFSYSTDCEEGETPVDAFRRALVEVNRVLSAMEKQLIESLTHK